MKKITFYIFCMAIVLGIASTASAVPVYEYYEGAQYVREGQQYSFFFDLAFGNDPAEATDSDLTLANDVILDEGTVLGSAYINIDLFSLDWPRESVGIQLLALTDNTQYELFNGSFNGYWPGQTNQNFHFDISNTSFMDDPYGIISIVANITPWYNFNDFYITEVGIGGSTGAAPVPEPATLLLLGTGLLGVVGAHRKRFNKKA